jgi:hypothetical protein
LSLALIQANISGSGDFFTFFVTLWHSGPPNPFVEHSKTEKPAADSQKRPTPMDATANFSLRFAPAELLTIYEAGFYTTT